MNRDEIKQILPHREPMLLVDESSLAEDGSAVGSYHVTGEEWFVQGHFPGNPTVPGVVLCEMMAQNCCVLLAGETAGVTPYFTSMNNVRFKKPVHPGDTLELHGEITRRKGPFCFASGEAKVGGEVVCTAEFSFALVK